MPQPGRLRRERWTARPQPPGRPDVVLGPASKFGFPREGRRVATWVLRVWEAADAACPTGTGRKGGAGDRQAGLPASGPGQGWPPSATSFPASCPVTLSDGPPVSCPKSPTSPPPFNSGALCPFAKVSGRKAGSSADPCRPALPGPSACVCHGKTPTLRPGRDLSSSPWPNEPGYRVPELALWLGGTAAAPCSPHPPPPRGSGPERLPAGTRAPARLLSLGKEKGSFWEVPVVPGGGSMLGSRDEGVCWPPAPRRSRGKDNSRHSLLPTMGLWRGAQGPLHPSQGTPGRPACWASRPKGLC